MRATDAASCASKRSWRPTRASRSTWTSRSPRWCSLPCRWSDALSRVRFASFSARRLAVLRRQEPRATTSLGGCDIAGLMLLSEAALPLPHTRWGWTRGRVDAVQVPTAYRGLPVVTRRFVAQAHAAGLEVHVWTIDDPEEMRRLAALNVDAVMTDVPSLALEALGSRGYSHRCSGEGQ